MWFSWGPMCLRANVSKGFTNSVVFVQKVCFKPPFTWLLWIQQYNIPKKIELHWTWFHWKLGSVNTYSPQKEKKNRTRVYQWFFESSKLQQQKITFLLLFLPFDLEKIFFVSHDISMILRSLHGVPWKKRRENSERVNPTEDCVWNSLLG